MLGPWRWRWRTASARRGGGRERVEFGRHWVAALLLPVLGVVAAGVFDLHNAIRNERGDVLRLTELLTVQAQRTIDAQAATLAVVDASVSGLSWNQIRTSTTVHAMLARYAATSETIETLMVIDPDGRIVAHSDATTAPPVDVSDRDYVQTFHQRAAPPALFVSGPVVSRMSGQFINHIARPRYATDPASDGFDGGVIVAGLPPDLIESVFSRVTDSFDTRITLLRTDGALLARVPDRLRPGGPVKLADSDPAWPLLRAVMEEPNAEVAARAHTVVEGIWPTNIRITGVAALPGVPMLMLIESDPALILHEWLTSMVFPTLGGVTVMALLLTLTARVRRDMRHERDRSALRLVAAKASQHVSQQRAELEARLRQTEKAAALGQLAAGVAHDFNNLLHAVLLGADGLRRAGGKSPQSEDIQRGVRLIERTAERGVALTRRMLDFARRDDPPDAGGFDPGQALVQAVELLTHSFGQLWPVTLTVPAAGLPVVAGDSATFETVIINLAVNARDAMPRGGRIEIAAGVDADLDGAALLSGMSTVRVVVSDTGAGMDPATLARAGEAFFTTKPVGAGTGLGLSMARGFAQRVGGLLEIASEPKVGTVITLRLPIVAG